MDNKNLIIAVVLCVAILWGYTTFIAPQPEKSPAQVATQRQQAQNAAKQPAASTAPAYSPQGSQGLPATAAPGAAAAPVVNQAPDVVVNTPLYRAVFSQRGGALRRVILKKYTQQPQGQGGEYVLLDLSGSDPYSLGLSLPGLDPALDRRLYEPNVKELSLAPGQEPKSLVFTTQSAGIKVVKTYTFKPQNYAFELKVSLTNLGGAALELTPELVLAEHADKAQGNTYAFTGLLAYVDHSLFEESHSDLEKKKIKSGSIDWMAMSIPYFLGAVAPLGQEAATLKRSARGFAEANLMTATLVEPSIQLAPGQESSQSYLVYYGPRDLELMEPLGHNLERAVDFGYLDLLAKPMLAALNFLEGHVGNYGIAIIIITILIKLVFWPLSQKSYKSMKKMQDLKPHIDKLREKYKDDKMKLQQETMQLYKTYKVNPMGGCLPMVLQIPVFIAFYKVLGASIELRHAPFFLWINDLAAPDRLPIGFEIPYVGHGIPVLTLLMGASMFIQQKMTPTTGDPTQAKMMLLMPVVFTFMFINFPSGLVLYWLFNNVLSIGQQYWTNKQRAK
ncbi:MAG: membrane protein insertase YidC [Pseudomonadota bacterium]